MTRIRAFRTTDWLALWALIEPVFLSGETYAVPRDFTQASAREQNLTTMQYNLMVSTNQTAIRLWQRHSFRSPVYYPTPSVIPPQGWWMLFHTSTALSPPV
ncbi:hypothetical protein SAMN04487955_101175 [Halomonas korlensis]|uniref:Uncharacterized protein n=1 Tax=Halomonas korlensis TaxID=463301 RepID=A0A1I7F1X9_9GAMM|nr:hypothetical protein SAMN04487955_101175 [Halomonas korlensis]